MRGDCAEAVTFPPAFYSPGYALWIGVCVRLGYLIKVNPQIEDPNLIYPGDTAHLATLV